MSNENGLKQPVQSSSNGDLSSKASTNQGGAYIPPHARKRILEQPQNGGGDQDRGGYDRGYDDRGAFGRSRGGYGDRGGDRGGYGNYDRRDRGGYGGYDRRDRGGYGGDRGGYNDRRYGGDRGDRGGYGGDRGGYNDRRGGGGNSKWKGDLHDREAAKSVGEDGLLPRNPRTERELFGETSGSSHTPGINFNKYKDIPVKATGNDPPEPISSFDEADLGPVVKHNIGLSGFKDPTPVQRYSLPIVTARRDLMACAQTGSGKTAAFLFPIIANLTKDDLQPKEPQDRNDRYGGYGRRKAHPFALILAPTRELASQIQLEARKFTYRSNIRSVVVYGGSDIRRQLRELERGCHLLVATPGRLVDIIERGKVSLANIKYLCLDEADRMLDMGFEKQIRHIVEENDMPNTRQTLMFSATFPEVIQQLAQDFLDDYIFLCVGVLGSTTDNITQKILRVADYEKRKVLLDILSNSYPHGDETANQNLTLVFVETKRSADAIEDYLFNQGFGCTSIHGDRTQREREAALHSFRSGRTPIIVATDVAARGLDIPNVTHVINFDLPHDIADYVHRIGRTGRVGNQGLATAFYCDKNRNIVRGLVELLSSASQEIPPWLEDASISASRGGYSRGKPGKRGGYGRRGGGGGRYGGGGARSRNPDFYQRGSQGGNYGGNYGGGGGNSGFSFGGSDIRY